MKLAEICERVLTLKMSIQEARLRLTHAGVRFPAAEELLLLWISDEWEQSTGRASKPPPVELTAHVTYDGRQYRVTVEEE